MVGEPTPAQATAPARSPPVEVNAQQLIAPEAVEAIPGLEFDQTANLAPEAGDFQWMSPVDADAEPGYVERDLRKFLECGILAHGFARARCFIPRALATSEKRLVCAQTFLGKPGAAAAFVFDRDGVCDGLVA